MQATVEWPETGGQVIDDQILIRGGPKSGACRTTTENSRLVTTRVALTRTDSCRWTVERCGSCYRTRATAQGRIATGSRPSHGRRARAPKRRAGGRGGASLRNGARLQDADGSGRP